MTSVLLFPMVSAAEEAEMNRDSGIEVLLIGSDRKDDSWNGNSDSMILISVSPVLKELTPAEMVQFISEVLPQVSHNFSITELADLLKMAESWMEYEFVEDRIPYDDLYYSEGGNLIPKMEETIERLHNMLYTEE